MGYTAYVKAVMLKPDDDDADSEICIDSVGDIDRLLILLRQVIQDISEESNVSAQTLAEAVVSENQELFEKNLEKVIEELHGSEKGFVWRMKNK